jgi:predicted nucleic acid-binding protein
VSDLVVDASVTVKWFIPEIHSFEAQQLLAPGNALFGPDVLWPEFGNVLWKKVRRNEIDPTTARDAVRELEEIPLAIESSIGLTVDALQIATETGRTVYNCLYLTLARRLDCLLVTADRRFYNAMQGTPYAGTMLWVEDVP